LSLSAGRVPGLLSARAPLRSQPRDPVLALGIALAASLLSLVQRRLSTRARSIRRRAVSVSGEIVFSDGSRESIDARSLIGAGEGALSILWVALLAVSLAVLLAHWL